MNRTPAEVIAGAIAKHNDEADGEVLAGVMLEALEAAGLAVAPIEELAENARGAAEAMRAACIKACQAIEGHDADLAAEAIARLPMPPAQGAKAMSDNLITLGEGDRTVTIESGALVPIRAPNSTLWDDGRVIQVTPYCVVLLVGEVVACTIDRKTGRAISINDHDFGWWYVDIERLRTKGPFGVRDRAT